MVPHHSPSSSVDTVRAYPPLSPSLPTQEEDLGLRTSKPTHSKSKTSDTDSEEDEPENTDEAAEDTDGVYPPTSEEEAETRRVEENLHRLEVAERQRRKSKRESAYSDPGPSLVSEITRRTSLLWNGRRASKGRPSTPNSSLGTHTQLQSEDSADDVPLHAVVTIATPPRTNSPENPFTSLMDNETSPFSDPERPAMMTATSESSLTTPTAKKPESSPFSKPRPQSQWNPPKPLDLPPPISPPPLNPAEFIQPAATTPPQIEPHTTLEEKEVRWWHEWLCGLSEGPDRGGDKQSGRTNPFE